MNTPEKKEHDESIDKKKVLKRARHGEICGGPVSYFNTRRHEQTKKHIDSNYVQFVKFEIV